MLEYPSVEIGRTFELLLGLAIVAIGYVALYLWLRPPPDHFELLVPPSGTTLSSPSTGAELALRKLSELRTAVDSGPLRHRLRDARVLLDKGLFCPDIEPAQLGVRIIEVEFDGIAAEWVLGDAANADMRLLYLHGGAFAVGSRLSHRQLTADIARHSGCAVLVIDYRLMPEHPRRAAFDDALSGYAYMAENGPDGPSHARKTFVAGDSAGGALTLSLIQHLKTSALLQASAAVAMSPLTDCSGLSASLRSNIATDPMLGPHLGLLTRLPKTLGRLAVLITMRHRPGNPIISPLLGELDNLPPTLIHASTHEMLRDDAYRYYSKAQAAGSSVVLETWPHMLHVWQMFGRDLPEAAESLTKIAAFIRAHH